MLGLSVVNMANRALRRTDPQGMWPISQPSAELVVETALSELAARLPIPVDWRQSATELLTLLGLDASLSARCILAHDLGNCGAPTDGAVMAMMDRWLHAEILSLLPFAYGIITDPGENARYMLGSPQET